MGREKRLVAEYPAKLLALYEDINGNLKALVHSTHYKMATNREVPHGDSRLVTHYHLEFIKWTREPKLYSVPFEDIIVAYEAIQYSQPLVPRINGAARQKEHTVMTMDPRKQWAKEFLEWAKELKHRQETVHGRDRHRLAW